MNKIQFSNTGFPETIETWEHLQNANIEIFSALSEMIGNKVIISGVEENNGYYNNGFIVIDSEVIKVLGGAGTHIKITETIENQPYNVDINNDGYSELLPAYITRFGVINNDEGIAISDFFRLKNLKNFQLLPLVEDANYVHTDNNYTSLEKTKLETIEEGAEVNVQTNWLQNDFLADDYLKNKPIIENILHSGEVYLGNFPYNTNDGIQVDFPDIGTNNYKVRHVVKSLSPIGSQGQDLIFSCTSHYTSNSFRFLAGNNGHYGGYGQNIHLYYELIEI